MNRLTKGCCPVHGLQMPQVGLTEDQCQFVVECPRKDCSIQGTSSEPYGPVELLREYQHLVGPSLVSAE